MSTSNAELVRSSFEAFLGGDWDALSEVMHPDVRWRSHDPGEPERRDRAEVLAALADRRRHGLVAAIEDVVAVDDRVFVEISGPRLREQGVPGGQACMVITVRDGKIARMQDYPSRAAALAALALSPQEAATDEPAPDLTRVTQTIRTGDAASLQELLREQPELATARLGDPGQGQSRTLLHLVTDWPGHVPQAAAKIQALVAAGAEVDARFTGPHTETPLHWAASSDDVEALDALLDAGADIEAPGAVIGGGTAIADAVAFGQWAAAGRLLERGARTNLWQAAALGLADRVRDELAHSRPAQEDLDNALWCAAHGGRHETAELLLEQGADPGWVGHDDLTAAQAAERSGAHELAAWLRGL